MNSKERILKVLKAAGFEPVKLLGTKEPCGQCITYKLNKLYACVSGFTRTGRAWCQLLSVKNSTIENITEDAARLLGLEYDNKRGAALLWSTGGGTRETQEQRKRAGALGLGVNYYTGRDSDTVYLVFEPARVFGLNK